MLFSPINTPSQPLPAFLYPSGHAPHFQMLTPYSQSLTVPTTLTITSYLPSNCQSIVFLLPYSDHSWGSSVPRTYPSIRIPESRCWFVTVWLNLQVVLLRM
jgi:hypothetical protein